MTNNKINQFIILTKRNFRTYLGIAISIILFIQFFQPFSFDKFDFENKLLFISGFGVIVLITLFISQLIFQKVIFQTGKEITQNVIYLPLYYFFQIVATSLGFIFYIHYVGQNTTTFNSVVRVIFICMSLPITIYLKNNFFTLQQRLNKYSNEVRELKEKLRKVTESYDNKVIEIKSDNDSDNFRIQVSDIVYVKSADNYVEIGYFDEAVVKKRMVRNTLKRIEQQLTEFNNFIRTHRTSLVNIQYIKKLHKNFNTYWLSLEFTKDTIPVSRQHLLTVKEIL